LIGRNNSLDTT